MTEPRTLAHDSSYPYATLDQALQEFGTAKDFIFGTGVSVVDGIKALHTQISFALSMAFPHARGGPAASITECPEEFAKKLAELAGAAAPEGKVDVPSGRGASWITIALMIAELLKQWLSK